MTNFENELRRLSDEWRERGDDLDSMMRALRAEIEFLKGMKAGRAAMQDRL